MYLSIDDSLFGQPVYLFEQTQVLQAKTNAFRQHEAVFGHSETMSGSM